MGKHGESLGAVLLSAVAALIFLGCFVYAWVFDHPSGKLSSLMLLIYGVINFLICIYKYKKSRK